METKLGEKRPIPDFSNCPKAKRVLPPVLLLPVVPDPDEFDLSKQLDSFINAI